MKCLLLLDLFIRYLLKIDPEREIFQKELFCSLCFCGHSVLYWRRHFWLLEYYASGGDDTVVDVVAGS